MVVGRVAARIRSECPRGLVEMHAVVAAGRSIAVSPRRTDSSSARRRGTDDKPPILGVSEGKLPTAAGGDSLNLVRCGEIGDGWGEARAYRAARLCSLEGRGSTRRQARAALVPRGARDRSRGGCEQRHKARGAAEKAQNVRVFRGRRLTACCSELASIDQRCHTHRDTGRAEQPLRVASWEAVLGFCFGQPAGRPTERRRRPLISTNIASNQTRYLWQRRPCRILREEEEMMRLGAG
jgi:hypothetical protein